MDRYLLEALSDRDSPLPFMNLYPFINGAIPGFLELKSHDERALSLPFWSWNYLPSTINWDQVSVSRVLFGYLLVDTYFLAYRRELLKELFSPHLASLACERLHTHSHSLMLIQRVGVLSNWGKRLFKTLEEPVQTSRHQGCKVSSFIQT